MTCSEDRGHSSRYQTRSLLLLSLLLVELPLHKGVGKFMCIPVLGSSYEERGCGA